MTGRYLRFWIAGVTLALVVFASSRAEAGVTIYTSSTDFDSAIAGYSTTIENYSTFTNGTLINAGDSYDGFTYTAFTPGPSGTLQGGIITNQFDSFSGLSLGGNQSTGQQFFYGQDSVTITFAAPVNAFGLFFNVNPNSCTYGLNTALGSGFTDSTSYDTSTFVFVGLVSTDTQFTSATITSTDASLGSYNIPELISASVPEPSSLALGLTGLLLVGGTAFIRHLRTRSSHLVSS
jgi:hypothetical protein